MKNSDDVQSAFNLAIGLKAETPQEYLLKAITYCITGYEKSSVIYFMVTNKLFISISSRMIRNNNKVS